MNNKTQSVAEFLDTLQQEYFVAEIRKKIYRKEKDIQFYKKLMDFKKQKIDKIQKSHNLVTIFNSDVIHNEYQQSICPELEHPRFYMTENDIRNYFSNGCVVKIKEEGVIKTGIIIDCDLKNNLIFVKLRGDSKQRPFLCQKVTRVL